MDTTSSHWFMYSITLIATAASSFRPIPPKIMCRFFSISSRNERARIKSPGMIFKSPRSDSADSIPNFKTCIGLLDSQPLVEGNATFGTLRV